MDDDTDAGSLQARIARLRREVYSRGGVDSPLVDALDPISGEPLRLRANELELLEAERRLQSLEHPAVELVPPVPPVPPVEDAPEFPGDQPGERREPASRRAWTSGMIAAASVIAIVLSAGGFALGRVSPAARPTPTPVAASASAAPRPAPGLEIFNGTQEPEDVPLVLLGSGVDPTSIRSFGNFGSTPEDALTYVARTVSGLVCLAVVLPDRTNSMTCVSEPRYSAEGLRLRLSTAETVPNPDSEGAPQPVFYEYFWARDGSLAMTSNSRSFAIGDGT